jgi:hypothetical protein
LASHSASTGGPQGVLDGGTWALDTYAGTSDPVTDGEHGVPRTASETRPRNIALVPVIKVKNIAGSDAEVIGANADTLDGLHSRDFLLRNEGINFKNKLINGNFGIWQRGTSLTAAASSRNLSDRWRTIGQGTTIAPQQQAFALGQNIVPNEPEYFHRVIVNSIAGISNSATIQQRIESVRTLAGKTVTLSFWAKADSDKNMAIDFCQVFGTGGSYSPLVDSIGAIKLSLTDTWQKFTITTTIPSISGKVLGTNNDDFLSIRFWLDAGSYYNTQSSNLGQQSGTFDIAQVQLEEGSVATSFEQRPYVIEFAMCQRFYQTTFQGVPAGTAGAIGAVGRALDATCLYGSLHTILPVVMRTTPTPHVYSTGGTINKLTGDANEYNAVITALGPNSIRITANNVSIGANAYISAHYTLDAEL